MTENDIVTLLVLLASKNQNPREGIETPSGSRTFDGLPAQTSKNQNPREGIETRLARPSVPPAPPFLQKTKIPARGSKQERSEKRDRRLVCVSSKNQNPREGIETSNVPRPTLPPLQAQLQKTKIPARGLKHDGGTYSLLAGAGTFKKPKSPRGD